MQKWLLMQMRQQWAVATLLSCFCAAFVVVAVTAAPPATIASLSFTESFVTTLFVQRATLRPTASMPNITLVTHATIDRLAHISRWCKTFQGPMSISIFIRPIVDEPKAIVSAFSADECLAVHADLHTVRETDHYFNDSEDRGRDMMTHYPFNVQRNAALDGATGDLVLLMDADFHLLPLHSDGAEPKLRSEYEQALDFLRRNSNSVEEDFTSSMFVVPAVETVTKEVPIPQSLDALVDAVQSMDVVPFYGHYCKVCHRPTDLSKFLRSPTPYRVEYQEGYEPYVIANVSSAALSKRNGQVTAWPFPKYNESFVGRGFDKMSFFFELYLQQRPFMVLPHFFIAHSGRGDLPDFFVPQTSEYKQRQKVNHILMNDFKQRVRRQYGSIVAVSPQGISEFDDDGEDAGDCGTVDQGSCKGKESIKPVVTHHVVNDEYLWRATKTILWEQFGSGLGYPKRCVVAALPTAGNVDGNSEFNATRLRIAAHWACERMDCRGLSSRSGSAFQSLQRKSSTSAAVPFEIIFGKILTTENDSWVSQWQLLSDADWVFDRWFHLGLSKGLAEEIACNFTGLARIAERDDVTLDSEVTSSLSHGCTVNPATQFSSAKLQQIVDSLCATSKVPLSVKDAVRSSRKGKRTGLLGPERCEALFQSIHPIARSDLRLRASVVLNAHHLMFGGRWRKGESELLTCHELYPNVATPVFLDGATASATPGAPATEPAADEEVVDYCKGHQNDYYYQDEDPLLTVDDPLFLRATKNIDWSFISASETWFTPKPGDATCITAHRLSLCSSKYNRSEHLEAALQLEFAIGWACSQMDCGPLNVNDDGTPRSRTFPENIVAKSDWVFARWFHRAKRDKGENDRQACHFNGAARLQVTTSVGERYFPSETIGCTLNPEALVSKSKLERLVHYLCGTSTEIETSGTDELGRFLQSSRVDRIGGKCEYLFGKIDAYMQGDVRIKASVALMAHHQMFFAGGQGLTCRRRFGSIAAYLAPPPAVHSEK